MPSPDNNAPDLTARRQPRSPGRATKWARGTAGKAFFIMMLALLPLVLASMASSLYSLRAANQEKQEFLQVSARQYAGQLNADIQIIRTALKITSGVLVTDHSSGDICTRLQTLFDSMTGPAGINVVIFDRAGKVRCQSAHHAGAMLDALKQQGALSSGNIYSPDMPDAFLAPGLNGLLIHSASEDGSFMALALYHHKALLKLTHEGYKDSLSDQSDQSITLVQDGISMSVTRVPPDFSSAPMVEVKAPVTDDNLVLSLKTVDRLTLDYQWIWLLMPVFLWIAAVFLGWLVVRWLLIKPLMALNHEVAAYVPGQIIHPPHLSRLASGEIIELGERFHLMSENVAEHEGKIQDALERQTRLTREVHHRVKNNLQIISSLISLHWRAAGDPQAAHAYLSIQRRVDALAVVQRNHYAELSEDVGLQARPMMNEIASGLKISARVQSGQTIHIAVDCDDVMLHQDVAAPIAFMTAELADIVIAQDPDGPFTLSLLRLENDASRARFALSAPVFRNIVRDENSPVDLYERVLTGLARQLRTPLGYDGETGEYHLLVPIIG